MNNMNRYPTPPHSPKTNWDNLSSSPNSLEEDPATQTVFLNPNTPAHQAERLHHNVEQNLVEALVDGSTHLNPDHSSPNATANDYYSVYNSINHGYINRGSASRLIETIPAPSEQENSSPEQVLGTLIGDKQTRGILAMASGRGFNNRDRVTSEDITLALGRFSTPLSFISTETSFLENIKAHNPPEKYAQYQDAMANFKQQLYGDRLLYSDAYLGLERQAARQQSLNNSRGVVIQSYRNHSSTNTNPSNESIIESTAPYMAPEMQERFGDIQARVNNSNSVSKADKKKPGLFSKLFGRKS